MTNPNAWRDFLAQIDLAWPVSRFRDVGVVVGCSGGADSVGLLRGLVEMASGGWRPDELRPPKGFFVLAHFNHGFRGQDSRDDEAFVGRLASRLGIEFEVARGDCDRRDEESARRQRWEFFRRVMRSRGARYLALGHSLDDNVETVLYRLLRGTGPAGLAGMAAFRTLSETPIDSDFVVARPMLGIRRDAIRDALRQRGFDWREDQSNQSSRYRRNWIRNELLPQIQSEFPGAIDAVGRAIDVQRQWQSVMQRGVQAWLDSFRLETHPLILRRLDCGPSRPAQSLAGGATGVPKFEVPQAGSLSQQAITIEALRRCWHELEWPLQSMGQTHWDRMYRLLCGTGSDVITLPGSIEARRDEQRVTLHRDR